jgi:hypothetical protein
VQFDVICRAHAGRRRQVHAGVADRCCHAGEGPRLVLDLNDQVERNRCAPFAAVVAVDSVICAAN